MPHWLAWFITFNFLNYSFVIFRAENMDTATTMFKTMFSGKIVIYEKFESFLGFLTPYGIEFGDVFKHIYGKTQTVVYITLAFIIVLKMKNSTYFKDNFQANTYTLATALIMFIAAVSMASKFTEFLYFNF